MKKNIASRLIIVFVAFAFVAVSVFDITVTPAKLELRWEREFVQNKAEISSNKLLPGMEMQLQQISEYKLKTHTERKDNHTKVSYHLEFIQPISSEKLIALTPKLRSIFQGIPLQLVCAEQYETYTVRFFNLMTYRIKSSYATFRASLDDENSKARIAD